MATEELLALLLLSSRGEALGISPAPQAARLPGGGPQPQAKAQLLLQEDKGPGGPCKVLMDFLFLQGAAAHPDSEEQQQRLREAAEGLRMATNAAAQNAIKKKLVHKLEVRRWAKGLWRASRYGQQTRPGWEPLRFSFLEG